MHFNDGTFWKKLLRHAKEAGRRVVYPALILYYALSEPALPAWARGTIWGALAYLVMPFDAIPDIIPGVGYSDDLTVLLLALAAVAVHINDKIRERARAKTEEWFGISLPDIDGFWIGSTSRGDVFGFNTDAVCMKLRRHEQTVSGTAGPGPEQQFPIRDGRIDPVNLRFAVECFGPTLNFDLFVDGPQMDGYFVRTLDDGSSVKHQVHLHHDRDAPDTR